MSSIEPSEYILVTDLKSVPPVRFVARRIRKDWYYYQQVRSISGTWSDKCRVSAKTSKVLLDFILYQVREKADLKSWPREHQGVLWA